MNGMNEEQEFEIIALVEQLNQVSARQPGASVTGRAKFLAEAQTYALPVSRTPKRRHIEWKTIFTRK